jgi:uncharacterized protein (DUF952 family)
MIYHLAEPDVWQAGLASSVGWYRPASLETQGFIHFSRADQLLGSAGRYYRGRTDLVLLEVDENNVTVAPRLVTEATVGTEAFPHLYGNLLLVAVCRTSEGFCVADDGSASWPEGWPSP